MLASPLMKEAAMSLALAACGCQQSTLPFFDSVYSSAQLLARQRRGKSGFSAPCCWRIRGKAGCEFVQVRTGSGDFLARIATQGASGHGRLLGTAHTRHLSNLLSSGIACSTVASAMKMATIFCSGEEAEGLVDGLLSFGASSCTIEDAKLNTPDEQEIYSRGPLPWHTGNRQLWDRSRVLAYFPADRNVDEALAMAADSMGLTTLPEHEVEEVVDNQNWVQQVQEMFKPVEAAEGLYIVPKWCTPPSMTAKNVILDPGLAFGTGDHPTTRLCLEWLHRVIQGGEAILDYGTGSGILALAALKMGAAKAVGVDCDPVAVSSAMYNASLNNLPDNSIELFLCESNGSLISSRKWPREEQPSLQKSCSYAAQFDVVVANILLNPLLELAIQISGYAKPGGFVGLSGILESQVEQLRSVYSEFLEQIEVSVETGWARLSGRRKTCPDEDTNILK